MDTAVLVPPALRDLLLSLAARDLFRPVWQDQILRELVRVTVHMHTVRGTSHEEAERGAMHVITQMTRAFPGARYEPEQWRPFIGAMTNDPKDRHVLAVAHAADATHIVTPNIRHFPITALRSDLIAASPDEFTCDLVERDPQGVVSAVADMSSRLHAPPVSPLQLARYMAAGQHVPEFGRRLLGLLDF